MERFKIIEIKFFFFFYSAPEDIRECSKIRTLIEDIENIRYSKIAAGIKKMTTPVVGYQFNNVSAMEINRHRHFVIATLQQLHEKLKDPLDLYSNIDANKSNNNSSDRNSNSNNINGYENSTTDNGGDDEQVREKNREAEASKQERRVLRRKKDEEDQ